MIVVYIAGPYQGKTHDHHSYWAIERNIARAGEAAAELARHGYGFFCPHLHSAHFEVIVPEATADYWRELDLTFLKVCDAVLMVGPWHESTGAVAERAKALSVGLPVFDSILDLARAMPPGSK